MKQVFAEPGRLIAGEYDPEGMYMGVAESDVIDNFREQCFC
jgi:hypothetical protein